MTLHQCFHGPSNRKNTVITDIYRLSDSCFRERISLNSGNVIVRYHCFHIFQIYQFYNFANVYIKQFKRHDSLLNHVSFIVYILIFTLGSPPKLPHLHLKHWSGIAYLPANLRFLPAQPAVYRCYPNQNLLMCRRE